MTSESGVLLPPVGVFKGLLHEPYIRFVTALQLNRQALHSHLHGERMGRAVDWQACPIVKPGFFVAAARCLCPAVGKE